MGYFSSFLITLFLFGIQPLKSWSSPSDPDSTFGKMQNGIVVHDLPDCTEEKVNAIALDCENRILLGGSCTQDGKSKLLLVRLTSKGSLDRSFHRSGKVIIGWSDRDGELNALGVDYQCHIVVGGSLSSGFFNQKKILALLRLKSSGELDDGFNEGKGWILTNIEDTEQEVIQAVAIDPIDNSIVVGGFGSKTNGLQMRYLLARYTEAGHLRRDFGDQGILLGVSEDEWKSNGINALAIDQDRKVLAGGFYYLYDTSYLLLMRLDFLGRADNRFRSTASGHYGAPGFIYVRLAKGVQGEVTDLGLDKSERIVMGASYKKEGEAAKFLLARLKKNGEFDASFYSTRTDEFVAGVGVHPMPFSARFEGLALQADDKLVGVGSFAHSGNSNQVVVARFLADGKLDEHWVTTFNGENDRLSGVVADPQGRIVIGGDSDGKVAAGRFKGEQITTAPFEIIKEPHAAEEPSEKAQESKDQDYPIVGDVGDVLQKVGPERFAIPEKQGLPEEEPSAVETPTVPSDVIELIATPEEITVARITRSPTTNEPTGEITGGGWCSFDPFSAYRSWHSYFSLWLVLPFLLLRRRYSQTFQKRD